MIAAAYAKNRRQDTLPLKIGTSVLLKKHLSDRMPAATAFNVPLPSRVVKMFRSDLAGARSNWIAQATTSDETRARNESPFLIYRNEAGRVIDFHALRHTFISNLAAGGVHPKTAQTLARHSTITLTMDFYTHLDVFDVGGALDKLPALPGPGPACQQEEGRRHA